ncbi:threonine-phosphate decarboxylase CobD [Thiospirillum jenense]|uniref:threonine-phosphate decarboxylase n=1 Tax=Thiospirillum jenense TaxID=1653858 RepID=A0A839HCC4_9GAMM|nr:threonine-phosphate decarboxylase CobD [Thiospirillum jenense]MBB1125076.1 threonine-phosphate decarboxylase [Thiospirillum jenense]
MTQLHLTRTLPHGGQLRRAATEYGIPLTDWLDLSTGINPRPWPVPAAVTSYWSRLPEADDGLETAAAQYYGSDQLLPVAGSQAAIQALPHLRPPCRVGILTPSYAEHQHAWALAGHQVLALTVGELDAAVAAADLDVLLLIHPNNPSGARFERAQLLNWHESLARRGGWLVVDEAFMDVTPEQSLVTDLPRTGLIVLRSLGKFFGLAGARVGFVFADDATRQAVGEHLGPWTVASPARWVATRALADRDWQITTRAWLPLAGERLAQVLTEQGLTPQGGCALFQWVVTPAAAALHSHLARAGILTRLFTTPAAVRFGLPNTAAEWQRLTAALGQLTRN